MQRRSQANGSSGSDSESGSESSSSQSGDERYTAQGSSSQGGTAGKAGAGTVRVPLPLPRAPANTQSLITPFVLPGEHGASKGNVKGDGKGKDKDNDSSAEEDEDADIDNENEEEGDEDIASGLAHVKKSKSLRAIPKAEGTGRGSLGSAGIDGGEGAGAQEAKGRAVSAPRMRPFSAGEGATRPGAHRLGASSGVANRKPSPSPGVRGMGRFAVGGGGDGLPVEGGSDGALKKTKKKRKPKKYVIGVNLSACKYQSVRRSIAAMGWKEVGEDEDWVLYWTDTSVSTERVMSLKRYQKINHFPGTIEISRKVNMARNLRRMEKVFPNDYNITPKTWLLPQELQQFKKVLSAKKKRVYIVKPDAGSQGKGIYLVRKLEDLNVPESGVFMSAVAQEYVRKPLLIDGYKFDMRIYALIMSCEPLKIFLYKEGMGRFCTDPYEEPKEKNMDNIYMHLTNYSINKNNDKFVYTDNPDSFGEGSKRTLSAMKSILEERGIDWDALWEKIGDIIIKTIICVQPMLAHMYRTCAPDGVEGSACFELLGFDIIIDNQLKPLLLEVNHSPSLSCDSGIDTYIKDNLLKSVCNLLHIDSDYIRRYMKDEKLRAHQRIFGSRRKDDLISLDKEIQKEKVAEMLDKWEEEHMGNFTRIYPSEKSTKYDEFFTAAWGGGFAGVETQLTAAKKLQVQKKVEEQMKSSKPPLGKNADKDKRGTEKKSSERPISAKLEKATEFNGGKGQGTGSNMILNERQHDAISVTEEGSFRKGNSSDVEREIVGPMKSKPPTLNRLPSSFSIYDESQSQENPSSPVFDVLGLSELQVSELCLPACEDWKQQTEFQKRSVFVRSSGLKERLVVALSVMAEIQKNSKYFVNSSGKYLYKAQNQSVGEKGRPTLDEAQAALHKVDESNSENNAHVHDLSRGTAQRGNFQYLSDQASKISVYVPAHLQRLLLAEPKRPSSSQSRGNQAAVLPHPPNQQSHTNQSLRRGADGIRYSQPQTQNYSKFNPQEPSNPPSIGGPHSHTSHHNVSAANEAVVNTSHERGADVKGVAPSSEFVDGTRTEPVISSPDFANRAKSSSQLYHTQARFQSRLTMSNPPSSPIKKEAYTRERPSSTSVVVRPRVFSLSGNSINSRQGA